MCVAIFLPSHPSTATTLDAKESKTLRGKSLREKGLESGEEEALQQKENPPVSQVTTYRFRPFVTGSLLCPTVCPTPHPF